MKIYVASSWRNAQQEHIVKALRIIEKHLVYDFKHPTNGPFQWSDIDPNWQEWTPEQFKEKLNHPIADMGFHQDFKALKECDACVLVMPCGRSAHLELGYAIGMGKRTAILLSDGEPELMYRMVDLVTNDYEDLTKFLSESY